MHTGHFPYLDADGNPLITDSDVGGRLSSENFANRGDVIVRFDGSEDRIEIEMRRFTMASSEELAQEDFDALGLWAFASELDSPSRPDQMDEADDCTREWRDGCGIRVHYDGQSQLARSGADLRVTLPSGYRHNVEIITSDNDADPDYHNRGNVCVQDLHGSAEIELGSGLAFVIMAPDITPMPACSAGDIAACEGWPDGSGTEAWADECPCVASAGGFGETTVASQAGEAADITIDLTSPLWATIEAETEELGGCASVVTVPEFEPANPMITRSSVSGTARRPSDAAAPDGGYRVHASSSDCASVSNTEEPDDFAGDGNGDDQDLDDGRGRIEICAGCLRYLSCGDVLPGG